jgi:L-threonylcarbamoyladenylate synthase
MPARRTRSLDTRLLQAAASDDCATAVRLLAAGELVAVPTETVYGLAADARQPQAVLKIFAAKDRPRSHPLIVHLDSADRLAQWAAHIPPAAHALAQAFWPGPLTLLLHKAPWVDSTVTGGLDTIALRVPDHPVLLRVITSLGSGIAAPSANPHKRLSPTSAAQVMSGLSGRIAAVLDGGPCKVGLESTIVDLTGDTVRILRSGPITREQLQDVLGQPVELPARHDVSVPGNMQVHYQPHAPLHLLSRAQLLGYIETHPQEQLAALFHGAAPASLAAGVRLHHQSLPLEKEGYARELYQRLHALDSLQPGRILLESPPHEEAWLDVHDRLSRAATPLPTP